MEAMKQHKEAIISFYDKNKWLNMSQSNPSEKALLDIISKSKDTPLSYLKIKKMDDGRFKIGEEEPFITSFFILEENTSDANQFTIKTEEMSQTIGVKSEKTEQD